MTTEFPIIIDCQGATAEEMIAKMDVIIDGHPKAQTMVKALRSKGVTQQRIAASIGCSQAEISRWCNGKCKPGGELLLKLMALHGEKCG